MVDPPGNGTGDHHLRAIAAPYGRIMNSGVSSVLDTCTPEEVERAAEAFAYLGLTELAQLTRHIIGIDWRAADGTAERRLNNAFYGLEMGFVAAFERKYIEAPADFEPAVGEDDTLLGRHICPGEISVHEKTSSCTVGPDCTGDISHATARLHREGICERCPSGPDWAT
jgi:hypothetical protein